MKRALILSATALFGGIMMAPQAATAQQAIESLGLTVTTTPAIVSDYLFRGFSQTRERPAVQLTLDVEHSSGLYVGAFASNVTFLGLNARQEVDLMAGYRFELAGAKLDAGVVWYTYPGYDILAGGFDLNYVELQLRASYEIEPVKFVGLVAYSPEFQLETGTGLYVETGFDMALDFGFTVSARAGWQSIENNSRWGSDDWGVFSFGVSREIFGGVMGNLTVSHATVSSGSECFGGQKICGTRVVAGLSRPF